MFFWRFQHSPIVKTLNLNVWTLPLIFLHDFTLFGIDTHRNRSILLFSTPFDHFHFHPLAGLKWHPSRFFVLKKVHFVVVFVALEKKMGMFNTLFYFHSSLRYSVCRSLKSPLEVHTLSVSRFHSSDTSRHIFDSQNRFMVILVSCQTRWSLYLPLAICVDNLVGSGNPL